LLLVGHAGIDGFVEGRESVRGSHDLIVGF
jgi:hypothetical protein